MLWLAGGGRQRARRNRHRNGRDDLRSIIRESNSRIIIRESGGVESREQQNVWKERNGQLEEGGSGRVDWSGDDFLYEEAVSGGSAGQRRSVGDAGCGVSREV